MTDIHILRPSKETDKDKLSIDEAKQKLKPCPICGSKAYISKDIVDGFYFGWSVGCPRFCLNDGIHGIDENTPTEEHLSIFGLNTAEECVKKWNEKVDKLKLKGGTNEENYYR
jgi:hypothetical protein